MVRALNWAMKKMCHKVVVFLIVLQPCSRAFMYIDQSKAIISYYVN